MKKINNTILIISLVFFLSASNIKAQVVTEKDALTVANNWINYIIQKYGKWGTSDFAQCEHVYPLSKDGQMLGFFCEVKPKGYIIIPMCKALSPIKAYSALNNLDPDSEEGLTDLIKDSMARVLTHLERKAGPIQSINIQNLHQIMDTDYSEAWKDLEHNALKTDRNDPDIQSANNYQEGDSLLSSSWHQRPPYNDQCPDHDCTWKGSGYYNTNALVGCVATAGSQIIRYWNWPPTGNNGLSYYPIFEDPYDWPNMLNKYEYKSSSPTRFVDENGNPVTQAQINAVAELCYEVGRAAGMDYGCEGSATPTEDMETVFSVHYNYFCDKIEREDYEDWSWYYELQSQFNLNRPVQYRIEGHSIVADGWQGIGSIRLVHINYGWGHNDYHDPSNGDNTWFTLSELPGPDDEEYMLINISPFPSLGSTLALSYSADQTPTYRYVDRDASGFVSIFESGHYIQFLPNISLSSSSAMGSIVSIAGNYGKTSRLFTRGDITKGIRIGYAKIRLTNGGGIKFY